MHPPPKVALAGPAVVEQLAGARDLLHRATMMLCGADEDVKVPPLTVVAPTPYALCPTVEPRS